MQATKIKSVLTQALKPSRFSVMLKKVGKRFTDDRGSHSNSENWQWIESHASDFQKLAIDLDPKLWAETEQVSRQIAENATKILNSLEYSLGGGGVFPFLYFITRYTQPDCIVETGVAAGFSSYALLSAIRDNGKGKLYSSDFPYFRIPHPEKYIGILVEDSLKDNWDLYIEGDEANLPKILHQVNKIDVFHYDSDKSYSGRKMVMSAIANYLSKEAIILMDDIQDNSYFYDYVENNKIESWSVFEFEGKYVGMIGKL